MVLDDEEEDALANAAQETLLTFEKAVPAEEMCKAVLKLRESELCALHEDLLFQLRKATWLQSNQEDAREQKYNKWKDTAWSHKDPDINNQLTCLIDEADNTPNEWHHFFRRQPKQVKVAEKVANNSLPVLPSGMVGKGNNSHLSQMAAALRNMVMLLRKLVSIIPLHGKLVLISAG